MFLWKDDAASWIIFVCRCCVKMNLLSEKMTFFYHFFQAFYDSDFITIFEKKSI